MSVPRTPTALALLAALAAGASAQSLQSSFTNLLAIDDVEITPDQRYAVVRQNRSDGYVRVYDLSTGQLVASPAVGSFNDTCGEVLDAVAVTNTRAVVLGGRRCAILDLTNITNPVLAEPWVGFRPNDVAITPDGTIAVVRGGNSDGMAVGGTYLFDLASGAQIGFSAGVAPRYDYGGGPSYSFDTDSVAVTNRYAVCLSLAADVITTPAATRVTIWDLHPISGPPVVILETGTPSRSDLAGAPHDVAITPDGLHAVVRSEGALGIWTLTGGTATRIFAGALTNDPGPFLDTAMDSVEVTNDLVVTLANVTGPVPQTQVEVFGWTGARVSGRIPGRPHDLAISPDGTRALVRTGAGVALYQLTSLPIAGPLNPVDWIAAPSATNGYQSGLDSVAASNDSAVTLTQAPNLADTRVWFWSIARGQLEPISSTLIPNTRPTDVVITPDARSVVVTGNATVSIFHLGTGGRAFEHRPVGANAYYPWCDGAVASADHAVGFGQYGPQNGWISLVNTAPISTRYCTANPNSSGRRASILALGNASVSNNSLKLAVDGAPRNARGRFVYGPTQAQIPFGDGVQCVGGPVFGLRFLETNVGGSAFLAVNYASQTIPAGIVLPGATWNYQFLFLDQNSPGFGVNSSDGLSITFAP
ncbi:MAG: hypothetical protein NTY35_17700 [Planctomycetota bacterium]|nr:hypothetical protein [Planctomycetota bacterium]